MGNLCQLITQEKNDIFVELGWPNFVKDHLIECDDLLVSKYDGGIVFYSASIDISASEKEAIFFILKCGWASGS